MAQTESSEPAEPTDSVKSRFPLEGSINFDPTKFIHQPRVVPQGEEFKTTYWWQRLNFGLASGLYGVTDKEWRANNVPVMGFLSYDFNRISSLRATATYVQRAHQASGNMATTFGIDVDYLFNMTRYLRGYYAKDRLNMALAFGFGAMHTTADEVSNISSKATLGLYTGYRIGSKVELFAEPYFGFANDGIDRKENPSIYDLVYGVKAGVAMHLRPRTAEERDSLIYLNRRPFVEFSQGGTLPLAQGVMGLHGMGTGFQLSMGQWIDPALGYRLTAAFNDSYWGVEHKSAEVVGGMQIISPNHDIYHSTTVSVARLEALFNPMALSNQWQRKELRNWFGLNMSAGVEYGWLIKRGVANTSSRGMQTSTYGITGGLQFLLRTAPGTWLYVEPRYTLSNYAIPYTNISGSKSYTDHYASLNLGVRMQRTEPEVRAEFDSTFVRHFFMTAALGGARHVQPRKILGDASTNFTASLGLGYRWSPLHAARLRAEFMRYGYNETLAYASQGEMVNGHYVPVTYHALWHRTMNMVNLKAGYMINLSTLWNGHDNNRRFNTYFELGPMFSINTKEQFRLNDGEQPGGSAYSVRATDHTGTTAFGMFGSLLLDWRLTGNWHLQASTDAIYHFDESFWNAEYFKVFNPWLLQPTIGMGYAFIPKITTSRRGGEEDKEFDSDEHIEGEEYFYFNRRPFYELSQGLTYPLTGGLSGQHAIGTGLQLSVGRWMTPVLGYRLTAAINQNYWRMQENGVVNYKNDPEQPLSPETKTYYDAFSYAARAEALFNPLALSSGWRNNPLSRWLSLNLSAGLQYEMLDKRGVPASGNDVKTENTSELGYTGAAQLLVRTAPGTWLFAEPRYIHSDGSDVANLSFGLRMHSASVAGDASGFAPHLFVTTAFGGARHIHPYKVLGESSTNYTASLGLGYHWSPTSAVRLRAEYMKYGYNDFVKYGQATSYPALYKRDMDIASLKLGYMMNLSTLWYGFSSERRFNAYVEAGPMFSANINDVHTGFYKYDKQNELHERSTDHTGMTSLGVFGGLLLDWRMAGNLHLQASTEAFYHINDKFWNETHYRYFNPWMIQPSVGIAYAFLRKDAISRYHGGDREGSSSESSYNLTPFVEFAQGLTYPMSGGLSGSHAMGTGFQLSVGQFVTPVWGYRVTAALSDGYSRMQEKGESFFEANEERIKLSPATKTYYEANSFAMRGEALFNPLALLPSWKERPASSWFRLNLSAGLQFGGVNENGDSKAVKKDRLAGESSTSVGITGAAQLLARTAPGTWLFAEPRYTNMSGLGVASLNFGVRLQREETIRDDSFAPYLFVTTAFGGARHILPRKVMGKTHSNYTASLGVGYQWSPLYALRLRAEYMKYGYNESVIYGETPYLWNRETDVATLKLGYMMNLSSMWNGHDRERRFNTYLELGPAWSTNLKENYTGAIVNFKENSELLSRRDDHKGNSSLGAFGGLLIDYRMAGNLHLQASTEALYQFNSSFWNETDEQAKTYYTYFNPLFIQPSVGLAYAFMPKEGSSRYNRGDREGSERTGSGNLFSNRWFMELSQSLNIPMSGSATGGHGMGTGFALSLGRSVTPVWGYRLGVSLNESYWKKDENGASVHHDETGQQPDLVLSPSTQSYYDSYSVSARAEA
ncbi:MAG: hypothetical protein J5486_00740, partial [Bacteroidaceae bacterium]|nr:hypothetical protein [Bacteroidaceae bacterium]